MLASEGAMPSHISRRTITPGRKGERGEGRRWWWEAPSDHRSLKGEASVLGHSSTDITSISGPRQARERRKHRLAIRHPGVVNRAIRHGMG